MSRTRQPTQPEVTSMRYDRLTKVFQKATDVSLDSIAESDLNECFGSARSQFGNALQKLFVNNMVVKAQHNATASFQDICIRYDIEEKLANLENFDMTQYEQQQQQQQQQATKSSSSSSSSSSSGFTAMDLDTPVDMTHILLQLKETEKSELLAAIASLESDMKRMSELASRSRTQVNNELSALTEERQKLQAASQHITSHPSNKRSIE